MAAEWHELFTKEDGKPAGALLLRPLKNGLHRVLAIRHERPENPIVGAEVGDAVRSGPPR